MSLWVPISHRTILKFSTAWISIFKAMWKTLGLRLKKILSNLESHSKLLDRHANLIAVQESKAMRTMAEEIIKTQLDSIRSDQKVAVTKWLDTSGPDHTDICSVHGRYNTILEEYGDTCDWFLNDTTVKQWVEGKSNKGLWLSGIPGIGKQSCSAHPKRRRTFLTHLQENPCLRQL